MNARTHLHIITGQDRSPRAAICRSLFPVAALGYGLGVRLRNAMFDHGWRRSVRLPRQVISIGNITAGGTGKTPHVLALARWLQAQQQTPAVLLRGYMPGQNRSHPPAAGYSDEALLLQAQLGTGVPVMAHPDRAAGAAAVLKAHPQVTHFLLDDGFQHRQVARDVDIVLIDATQPLGLGRLLPAGLLREPVRALTRAHAVILTRANLVSAKEREEIKALLASLAGKVPVIPSNLGWSHVIDEKDQAHPLETLQDRKIAAVAGIGNPGQFKTMLAQHFPNVVECFEQADHADYPPALIRQLAQQAHQRGATALLLTEKDWVKWRELVRREPLGLPVYRVELNIDFPEGFQALANLLQATCKTPR